MIYKIIARLKGWREAYDYDEKLLVVWHPSKHIHFTGPNAWKYAVQS